MRTRITIIVGTVALLTAVVIATQIGGGQPARDVVGGAPGVFSDPPFSVRLDGPLWRARTLQDNDGAQDFALVGRDLPLEVRATGASDARVAEVELRVDGRSTRVVVPRCPGGRCPVSTSFTFVPPLRMLGPSEHRVQIVVRDPAGVAGSSRHGEHVTTFGFDVRSVRSVPPISEARTVAKLPTRTAGLASRLRGDAVRVLTSARRGGGIAAALGSSRVSVVRAGRLEARGRPLGVTLLVKVTPPVYNVRATVPAYVPVVASGTVRYNTQQVQMHVEVLRDALVDVDLSSRRVITFEPGPHSRTSGWSPSKAPTPAGANDED
ncbi:MAG: hypothetical protein QOH76_2321 [Thermoleophilaceae bacterium]|nr:hypothetical protein [Thermoleophilaceae bacterium]